VVAIFCGALQRRSAPRVFGNGHQTRDYVYVGDIVDAFMSAAAAEAQGVYNVGTGVETSVLELGQLLAEIWGLEFDPEMAPPRPGEIQRIAIASARAERDLGWRATTALADGLRETVASYA
jgi:UDP-glucose 4-epimerase